MSTARTLLNCMEVAGVCATGAIQHYGSVTQSIETPPNDILLVRSGTLKHFTQLLGRGSLDENKELGHLLKEIDNSCISQPTDDKRGAEDIDWFHVADEWLNAICEYNATTSTRSFDNSQSQQTLWDTLTKHKIWVWNTYCQQDKLPQLPRFAAFTKNSSSPTVHQVPLIACLYGTQMLRGLKQQNDTYTLWYNYDNSWADTWNTRIAPVILVGRDPRYTAKDIELANAVSDANLGPNWNSAYGPENAPLPPDFHNLIIASGAARQQS